MKVLITGGQGQLAQALKALEPSCVTESRYAGRDTLDVTDASQVKDVINAFQPDVIINTAAYNAVDKAEEEKDAAFAVNKTALQNLCEAIAQSDTRLIHVSTDYVFNGKAHKPYQTSDATDPISVYGQSKLAGEQVVLNALGDRGAVVRTSWLYSSGDNNVATRLLSLMQERDELTMVADRVGSPTWVNSLANVLWAIVQDKSASGLFHCTDAGVASWYDFATALKEEAQTAGKFSTAATLKPISANDFQQAAKRPDFSVLDTLSSYKQLNVQPKHWREQVRAMLAQS